MIGDFILRRRIFKISKYFQNFKISPMQQIQMIREDRPNVVVGTPGRTLDLVQRGELPRWNAWHFVNKI